MSILNLGCAASAGGNDRTSGSSRRGRIAALALLAALSPLASAAVQDEIFGDDIEGLSHPACDSGLASDSSAGADFAAALDLCKTTTELGTGWGLISATLSLADGNGTPSTASHAIRTAFGSGNAPQAGSAFVVLATGAAAASGQTSPPYVAFQPGYVAGTQSAVPADWLTANGGSYAVGPGCPAAPDSTAHDPVMLTLRIRVPSNARSFSFSANFFSADFPEYVCGASNDMFVALLDSSYNGVPANPADRNLATYFAPGPTPYPLNVNLAKGNTGLFTQCVNGTIGCATAASGTINTCTGTNGLTGTGMDLADPPPGGSGCDATSQVGGGTGWLVVRGNVVPGETINLRLAIWDTSDGFWDSVILLDNFQWSYANVAAGVNLD